MAPGGFRMQPETREQVTQLLNASAAGDRRAAEELLPLVYDELRALAASFFGTPNPSHTLQPTALVHEAYMKLAKAPHAQWEGRRHFLEVAAKAMRQILANHARGRRRQKRGGDAHRVTLSAELSSSGDSHESMASVLDLEAALTSLEQTSPELSRLVELRYFAGLSFEDVGESLGVATRTLERQWRLAKAELRLRLSASGSETQE